MAKVEVSKAQRIREYATTNPNATPAEIAGALAVHGITVKQVYDIRTKDVAKAKATGKKAARKKMATRKKAAAETAAEREGRGGRGKNRPYPRRTLQEALAVPKAIREKNNGRPMGTEQVAKATLNVSKGNDRFFYVAAASRDYGLTIGSRDTDEIALTQLGQELFFAKDEETRKQKMIDAFMSVDLFNKVYEYYGGSKSIPTEGEFFGNVLVKEFKLDPEFHEEFEQIFRANCRDLEIEEGLSALASDKAKAKIKEPTSDDIRVVGAAKGKFDRTAFVIMPFSEKGVNPRPAGFFEAVLDCIIVPAGNSAG